MLEIKISCPALAILVCLFWFIALIFFISFGHNFVIVWPWESLEIHWLLKYATGAEKIVHRLCYCNISYISLLTILKYKLCMHRNWEYIPYVSFRLNGTYPLQLSETTLIKRFNPLLAASSHVSKPGFRHLQGHHVHCRFIRKVGAKHTLGVWFSFRNL